MKLFSNKKTVEPLKPDITFKIKLCPVHFDFCKMGTEKVQQQSVIANLRLIINCGGCKVVVE